MRFDVFPLPTGAGPGYVVDVQSDFLSNLPTRMVIPLIAADRYKNPIRDLHPIFQIAKLPFVLLTHELASIASRSLPKRVTSLADHQDQIARALDLLFTGF